MVTCDMIKIDLHMHSTVSDGTDTPLELLEKVRAKGIGLRMVQSATAMLAAEGYDIGYIHYTGVGPWYARLGYRTVLRWNRDGFVEQN